MYIIHIEHEHYGNLDELFPEWENLYGIYPTLESAEQARAALRDYLISLGPCPDARRDDHDLASHVYIYIKKVEDWSILSRMYDHENQKSPVEGNA